MREVKRQLLSAIPPMKSAEKYWPKIRPDDSAVVSLMVKPILRVKTGPYSGKM